MHSNFNDLKTETMEDINEFWNKYWHKPKKVMVNEFGHNKNNKELALKFAKAYADHKLKSLGIGDVVGQSEQLVCYKKCGDTQPYDDICLNCGSSINYDAN